MKPRDDKMLKASSRLPKTSEITNDRVTVPSDKRACTRMKIARTPDTMKGQIWAKSHALTDEGNARSNLPGVDCELRDFFTCQTATPIDMPVEQMMLKAVAMIVTQSLVPSVTYFSCETLT